MGGATNPRGPGGSTRSLLAQHGVPRPWGFGYPTDTGGAGDRGPRWPAGTPQGPRQDRGCRRLRCPLAEGYLRGPFRCRVSRSGPRGGSSFCGDIACDITGDIDRIRGRARRARPSASRCVSSSSLPWRRHDVRLAHGFAEGEQDAKRPTRTKARPHLCHRRRACHGHVGRRLAERVIRHGAPGRFSGDHRDHGVDAADRVPVRAGRPGVRRGEERPHQGLRQPLGHHADGLRGPPPAGAQLLGPGSAESDLGSELPDQALRVRAVRPQRRDRRDGASLADQRRHVR